MIRSEKSSDAWKKLRSLPDFVTVEAGVFQEEGGEEHSESGETVADIASFHEFGTRTIPQRSFLRAWFDANEERLQAFFATRLEALGVDQWDLALEQTALWVQAGIQKRIRSGIAPALAESTVQAKGSSKPLIDTSQLLTAITVRIDGRKVTL